MKTEIQLERLSPAQAAKEEGLHPATVWRWMLHGVKGRKLPSFLVGGRRYVLRRDWENFLMPIRDPQQVPCEQNPAAIVAGESLAKALDGWQGRQKPRLRPTSNRTGATPRSAGGQLDAESAETELPEECG